MNVIHRHTLKTAIDFFIFLFGGVCRFPRIFLTTSPISYYTFLAFDYNTTTTIILQLCVNSSIVHIASPLLHFTLFFFLFFSQFAFHLSSLFLFSIFFRSISISVSFWLFCRITTTFHGDKLLVIKHFTHFYKMEHTSVSRISEKCGIKSSFRVVNMKIK